MTEVIEYSFVCLLVGHRQYMGRKPNHTDRKKYLDTSEPFISIYVSTRRLNVRHHVFRDPSISSRDSSSMSAQRRASDMHVNVIGISAIPNHDAKNNFWGECSNCSFGLISYIQFKSVRIIDIAQPSRISPAPSHKRYICKLKLRNPKIMR